MELTSDQLCEFLMSNVFNRDPGNPVLNKVFSAQ